MEAIEPISGNLNHSIVWSTEAWIGFCVGTGISILIAYVVNAWLLSRIFKKAKVARWKAWVPIVNIWQYLRLGGRAGGNVFWGVGGYLLLLIGYTTYATSLIKEDISAMAPILCLVAMVLAIICLVIFIYKQIASTWNIQKKLGKSGWFLILYFINVIAPLWYWILALDKSKWNDKKGRPMIK